MRVFRALSAFGVATAIAVAGATVASAATVNHVPALPAGQQQLEGNDIVISPYNGRVICHSFHGQKNGCWQQRPDGRWESLAGIGPVSIYPVWEDPASIAGLVPQLPSLPAIPGF